MCGGALPAERAGWRPCMPRRMPSDLERARCKRALLWASAIPQLNSQFGALSFDYQPCYQVRDRRTGVPQYVPCETFQRVPGPPRNPAELYNTSTQRVLRALTRLPKQHHVVPGASSSTAAASAPEELAPADPTEWDPAYWEPLRSVPASVRCRDELPTVQIRGHRGCRICPGKWCYCGAPPAV